MKHLVFNDNLNCIKVFFTCIDKILNRYENQEYQGEFIFSSLIKQKLLNACFWFLRSFYSLIKNISDPSLKT